ncbi:hypothetical protein [Microbacterium sp. H1-D42]|uniref:hypothetical protein n=1 Tax=Microbacterium sp. H1-D42 TaxID=2925844 RepID=UPI001F5362D9|nr:hypothetical protein [Microbacterium sp. H1-D42]UNK70120.1 hypothetical protein MNR00_13245 [Microbacterium sp. H1-D42]
MSTLEQLFPDGPRRTDASADQVVDDHHTARRLDDLFGGDRRTDLDQTRRASARPALVAMVNDAVADARPLGTVPPVSKPDTRRPRRRVDWLTVSAAALAVVAIAAAGTIGGVQMATASPADDALRVLAVDEKTIETATSGLVSSTTRLTESIAESDASAEALRRVLESVRDATDPADIPEGETEAPEDADTIAIADPAALDVALAAIKSYRTDLAAFEVPAMPAEYARASVDTGSLSGVASAIDEAQQQLNEIDRVSAEVRTVRAAVDTRAAAFAAQLATFAKTFPAVAQKAVDAHPDAEQELKDAVIAAGAAVAASDLQSDAAPATLAEYRDAVAALAAGQVQVERDRERERAEQERIEREREQSAQPPPADPGEGESTPPPSEPTEPTPPPTEPPPGDEG